MSVTILTRAVKKTIMADLKASAVASYDGQFLAAIIRLFKNDITPDEDTVLADLTEADFDGYAESGAVTWGEVHNGNDGSVEMQAGSQEFHCTGGTTPNEIFGYMIVDSGGTTLLAAHRFDESELMSADDDNVTLIPTINL